MLILIRYNVENIVAVVRAAENKRSPLIIQVFPWAITASDGLLVRAAADAALRATVPVAIHLDHAQDEALIRYAADNLPFDSIMVDMSHHEKEENLAKTKELVEYCHARGIATEAEPGRLEGGEDGVADTVDLEGVLTTPEDVEQFIATGVDFLAPAFGNIHGESPYGKAGPQLDYARQAFDLCRPKQSLTSPQTGSDQEASERKSENCCSWHQRMARWRYTTRHPSRC